MRGIHRWLHKGPVTRKVVPFDGVIMWQRSPPVINATHPFILIIINEFANVYNYTMPISLQTILIYLKTKKNHYNDILMSTMASQITSVTIVYSTVYSDTDQGKHQSSASVAFVCGIHRWPVNSPHKLPETRKMFPFDDVIILEDIEIR